MKRKQFKAAIVLSYIICALPFYAVFTSCTSDDEEEQITEQDGRRMHHLTIVDVPMTRATLTDNGGNTLGAAWKVDGENVDKATYLNLSEVLQTNLYYGDLRASNSGSTATFSGDVWCRNLDKLAIIYPTMDDFTDNGSYTITLDGQKGTLDDLAQNYHYVYGVGEITVDNANPDNASGTISSMKSLLAVCKFTFKDKDTNTAIPVKTLNVGYYDTERNVPTVYSHTATLTPIKEKGAIKDIVNPADIELVPGTFSGLLTVTLPATVTTDSVYVALLPVNEKSDFYFSVTGSEGTFTGTAKAKLLAGNYYPVELKLSKTN